MGTVSYNTSLAWHVKVELAVSPITRHVEVGLIEFLMKTRVWHVEVGLVNTARVWYVEAGLKNGTFFFIYAAAVLVDS